tara:strand:+ start:2123 stop:2416 length:294 start_codon:yes stop_codon:yes gene_type:complete
MDLIDLIKQNYVFLNSKIDIFNEFKIDLVPIGTEIIAIIPNKNTDTKYDNNIITGKVQSMKYVNDEDDIFSIGLDSGISNVALLKNLRSDEVSFFKR